MTLNEKLKETIGNYIANTNNEHYARAFDIVSILVAADINNKLKAAINEGNQTKIALLSTKLTAVNETLNVLNPVYLNNLLKNMSKNNSKKEEVVYED